MSTIAERLSMAETAALEMARRGRQGERTDIVSSQPCDEIERPSHTPPPVPPPSRREREATRDAAVETVGHLSFKGEKCLPCPYCSTVYAARAFRRLQIDNHVVMVCRSCKDKALGHV